MAYTEKRKSGHIGCYRIDGRKKYTKVFTRKRDALAEATRLEDAGKAGTWTDPNRAKIRLSEYFETWMKGRADRAPRTRETESERFNSLVAPTFGEMNLDRITYEAVQAWSQSMTSKSGRPASQARRRDATRLLVAILDSALDAGMIARNPARTRSGKVPYKPAKSKTKPHRYLTHEQLARVADAAGGETKSLILIAGYSGLRWGEISALTVADTDPLRGRLNVNKAYTTLDSGQMVLGDTKTHATRSVPLPSPLLPLLVDQIAGKSRSSLVFSQSNGDPLRRENFARRHFEPAVTAAGCAVRTLQEALAMPEELRSGVVDTTTLRAIHELQRQAGVPVSDIVGHETWAAAVRRDGQARGHLTQGQKVSRTLLFKRLSAITLQPGSEDFERLTLHDLRHTAASLAISSGANVKQVQNLLGHESAEMTLNTYAGLFPDDQDRLADRMAQAMVASVAHYVPTTTESRQPALATVSAI